MLTREVVKLLVGMQRRSWEKDWKRGEGGLDALPALRQRHLACRMTFRLAHALDTVNALLQFSRMLISLVDPHTICAGGLRS